MEKEKKIKYVTHDELGDLVEERMKKVIGTVAVPDGYIKCKGCGRLILIEKKDDCPYCEKPEDEKDEDDEGVGIIGILEDED